MIEEILEFLNLLQKLIEFKKASTVVNVKIDITVNVYKR